MTFESQHPLARLAIDVAVSLALFAVACVFSEWVQNSVTPNLKWMYTFWFALGMLPCLLYMRYRAVVNFDNWDIIAFSPMPLVLGIAGTFLGHQLAILAVIPFIPVCLWIRHFLSQRKHVESEHDKSHQDDASATEPNAE